MVLYAQPEPVNSVGSRDGVDYTLEDRDGVLWIDAKGSPVSYTHLTLPTTERV